MFLRATTRKKDGKEHRYWSIVEIPTTDGRTITLTRYTEPERELKLLLERLRLELPAQPPPKITANQGETATLV